MTGFTIIFEAFNNNRNTRVNETFNSLKKFAKDYIFFYNRILLFYQNVYNSHITKFLNIILINSTHFARVKKEFK